MNDEVVAIAEDVALPNVEGMEPEAAQRLLDQRTWTVEEYFVLENQRRMEYSHGHIEVLPVATEKHQDIIEFCKERLKAYARAQVRGKTSFSGLRVRIAEKEFREPDVAFMKDINKHRRHDEYWEGADLVMEVVSRDLKDRMRDYEEKRLDYARAGIPEYWIIDPRDERITVLVLEGDVYRVHGEFGPGTVATSVLLEGFALSVDDVLAAE